MINLRRNAIPFLICTGLFLSACAVHLKSNDDLAKQIPNTSDERKLSDLLASGLINDRRKEIRENVEEEFRDAVDEKKFDSILDQFINTYGRPLEFKFKHDELEFKTYSDGQTKRVRKFWYAAKTTKYRKGSHYLIVEVIPEADKFAISSFAIVNFPFGVPANLK